MKLWQWLIALFVNPSKEGLSDDLHSMQKEVDEIFKPKRNHKKWSIDENAELITKWIDNQSIAYIAFSMDRTEASIRRKLNDLGFSVKHDAPRISQYDIAANKTL